MKLKALFRNPEIINNIHFFKLCEDERPKENPDWKESNF